MLDVGNWTVSEQFTCIVPACAKLDLRCTRTHRYNQAIKSILISIHSIKAPAPPPFAYPLFGVVRWVINKTHALVASQGQVGRCADIVCVCLLSVEVLACVALAATSLCSGRCCCSVLLPFPPGPVWAQVPFSVQMFSSVVPGSARPKFAGSMGNVFMWHCVLRNKI